MNSVLVEALDAKGWNPLSPSAECIEETRYPVIPSGLSHEDELGIRWYVGTLDICRQFDEETDAGDPDVSIRTIECGAILHGMRTMGMELTVPAYKVEHDRVFHWKFDRLDPADGRLAAAVKEARIVGRLVERSPELDPAWSLRHVIQELGWIDTEGGRLALAEALRMVERRGGRRWGRFPIRTKLDDVDVAAIIDMVTKKDRNRRLSHRSNGRFVLGAEEMRDAIELALGAVLPVRQAYGRKERDEERRRVGGLPDMFEHPVAGDDPRSRIHRAEDVALVRTFLAERRRIAEGNQVELVALDHFLRIRAEGESARQIARETGVNRVRLARALQRLEAELKKQLGEQ